MACPTIGSRIEGVGAAALQFRVISDHLFTKKVLCGTFVQFESGAPQMVIINDPFLAVCSLDALTPQKNKGKAQEFVSGALFFAIHETHVVLVQSSSVRANAFEEHLAWLLRAKTQLLPATQALALAGEPQKVTADRIRKSHVQSVSIGRPLMEPVANQVPVTQVVPGTGRKATTTTKISPSPSMLKAVRDFFTDDPFANMAIEDAVFEGNLEVRLEIRYPKRSRRRPLETFTLMDNLGVALRNQDEGSVELRLADDSVVQGKQLRNTTMLQLRSGSGVPQVRVLYDDMIVWFKSLLDTQVVPL